MRKKNITLHYNFAIGSCFGVFRYLAFFQHRIRHVLFNIANVRTFVTLDLREHCSPHCYCHSIILTSVRIVPDNF